MLWCFDFQSVCILWTITSDACNFFFYYCREDLGLRHCIHHNCYRKTPVAPTPSSQWILLGLDTTCWNFHTVPLQSQKAPLPPLPENGFCEAPTSSLIALFQNNLSYKQGGPPAEPRSQIYALAIREDGKVHLGLIQWEAKTQAVGNSSEVERVFKKW